MSGSLYLRLKQVLEHDGAAALATVIASASAAVRPGAKLLILEDGRSEGALGDGQLEGRVREDARTLLQREKSKTLSYEVEGKAVDVYIEALLPPAPLVIIGADPDAQPLVRLGAELGFKVVLVDHRPNFANRERYPDAHETIVCAPEELAGRVPLNRRTFVLVKSHNYLKDKAVLRAVLKSEARYVGQLGPRARLADLLEDLRKEGVEFTAAELQRLYGPVGLDIGAETAEEIAVSVFAEILAVRSGRTGGFLRQQTEAIHPRE